ncbi:MobA/MobL family protein, partial [Escherichia coli]|uniref:MobA/MobL family protein n=1 Tax=Escherichia coli TaxID=562 RepID=UPI003EE113A1
MQPIASGEYGKNRTHAETWRASWADHANRALTNAGYQEEIDHRSYERQGLEKTP